MFVLRLSHLCLPLSASVEGSDSENEDLYAALLGTDSSYEAEDLFVDVCILTLTDSLTRVSLLSSFFGICSS